MSTEKNKEIIKRLIMEVWGQGDMDLLADIVAIDFGVNHHRGVGGETVVHGDAESVSFRHFASPATHVGRFVQDCEGPTGTFLVLALIVAVHLAKHVHRILAGLSCEFIDEDVDRETDPVWTAVR